MIVLVRLGAALLALAVIRLLPESGAGLYLRLAVATAVLLFPGAAMARLLGSRGAAGTLAWTLALLVGALAFVFAVSAPLWPALVLLGAAAAMATSFGRGPPPIAIRGRGVVFALGVLFGIALWSVQGEVGGDGLFHLARVRKLVALDDLSLDAVGEFADGGLHPGYAFPLWHGFLGLVAQLAGVDPALVLEHEATVLVPLAFLVAYEAGRALFGSAWLGAAALAAQVALIALAPGNGGSYTALALPATASRQLLVPAALALVFAYLREPRRGLLVSVGAAGLALTLVHPTYSLFLVVPLAGFLFARAVFDLRDARRIAIATGAFLVPAGLAILWLLPVARDAASTDPTDAELARALGNYGHQLDVGSETSYRLAPEVISRGGAVAVAALALVPLAAAAARRRWGAFVLGGSIAVLLVMLVPDLFVRLSDAVSLSQSRRAAGFLPFAFAFAGGAWVLARNLGALVLPLALVAGIVLQLSTPGDFTADLVHGGGPALLAWFALLGAAAGLAAAAAVRVRARPLRNEMLAGLAALLFVLPVGVHAAANWSERQGAGSVLSEGLIEALREDVPERAVVFSDLETSYRVAAQVPVYVAAAPPAHVADTEDNRPYARRVDVQRFFRTGDLAIPRRYGAGWLIVDGRRFDVQPDLPVVYLDDRFTLYKIAR